MQSRPIKFFRRRLRRSQRQFETLGNQAESELERNFFRRLNNLSHVWRFATGWVLLVVLLIVLMAYQLESLGSHYQTLQPVPGGSYSEGIVGTFSNANPLYATSEVDTAVSRLIFSGLLTYNAQNHLVGALAKDWSVNSLGNVYTVHLKPHLTWQDGQPLTADDVVFTYQAIQNPDAQSPLASSWQGIAVAKKDATTITFTLPTPLTSFPYNLTTGIIPAHIFKKLTVADWRSADFNSLHPIGAGPFELNALQVEQNSVTNNQILIGLKPFPHYSGGAPKLDSFVIHTFNDPKDLIKTFQLHQLTAISLPVPPKSLLQDKSVTTYNFILTAATMAFLNTTSNILNDVAVRQALVQGTDTTAIIHSLGFATKPVREPLLIGQLGYDPKYVQASYDPAAANKALDAAGWKLGTDGRRHKNNQTLTLEFYAADTPEYHLVAGLLADDWKRLGVATDVHFETADDLHATVAARSYDVLLDSIAIGVDPDVFVYWDSSQTDPRSADLNFSDYKSATADAALEAGRTRLDPVLRAVKYQPFLQAWQHDAPAIGLYQPNFVYLTHQKIYGLNAKELNSGTDRFNNVQNWMIRTARVTNK